MSSIWVDLLGAKVGVTEGRYQGRYIEAGEGEPLILLHGQGGHVENFARNIMVAARYYHVFALDCAWHAYGPRPEFDPELLPVFVDQVLDFMDSRGIESAHIEGQSMGGWTAMRLAHDHPQRVRKLVLATVQGFNVEVPGLPPMEPTPGAALRERFVTYLRDPSYENIRGRLEVLFANPERVPEEMIHVRRKLYRDPIINDWLVKVLMTYMGGPESPAMRHLLDEKQLGEIQAPTFVFWSDKNTVPPPYGEKLAASIPGAIYYCALDTGHWAQYEAANEHNREVLRFLTGDNHLEPPAYDAIDL